ncbi:MAG: CDP-alcohol phosphatidyltransferase family protein [Dehalococcoidia bacterium]|nr:CDP-alcohol phosphatidyltransferase family protein [Dehalococcoidia bacterium]MDH5781353.1 CDP-alcohol phosphatidyltransferase family protein [Dehalococcoidia bacterium]
MPSLAELRGNLASRITNPLVGILSKSRLKPNTLTFIELAISIGVAYAIVIGYFLLGGVLVLVSGLFDLLDGALARFTKQSTKFGAILDSAVDRLSEAAIFCGLLIWYLPKEGATLEIVAIFAALIGSFLVSYIRARAEGLGLECRVGLFTRAERVIVLAVGLLVNQVFIALWVLVVFVYITVAQRLLYLRKQAKVKGG